MMSSKAVAVTFAAQVFQNAQWIMPILVSLSVFGSINGSILTGGRVVFAAARREHLPQVLSMVHVGHKTPGPAIIVQVAMILILTIPGDIDSLISISSFTSWIFSGLCAAAVLVLRRKFPDIPRPYRVPSAIPVIVVIFSLYLTIAPLVSSPDLAIVYGIAVMLFTPVIYYPFVHWKYKVPGMDNITIFLQEFFEVSPTDWEDKLASAKHED